MRPLLACAILALVVSMATAKPMSNNKALRSLLKAIAEKEKRLSFHDRPHGGSGSGEEGSGSFGSGGSGSFGSGGEGGEGGFFPGGGMGGIFDLLQDVLSQLREIKAALGLGGGFPMVGSQYKKGFGGKPGGAGGNGGQGHALGKPEKPEPEPFIDHSGEGGFKPPFGGSGSGDHEFKPPFGGSGDHGFKPPFGGSGDHEFKPPFGGSGSGDHGFKPPHGGSGDHGSGEEVRSLLSSFTEKDLKDLVRALEELKRK